MRAPRCCASPEAALTGGYRLACWAGAGLIATAVLVAAIMLRPAPKAGD